MLEEVRPIVTSSERASVVFQSEFLNEWRCEPVALMGGMVQPIGVVEPFRSTQGMEDGSQGETLQDAIVG